MDVVTHALVGAQAAHLTGRRWPEPGQAPGLLGRRERLLLGATAAAFPDLDFVAFPVDPLRFLAQWHQGPTHSLVLLPLWAALLSGLYRAATGGRAPVLETGFVCAIGIATHAVLDVFTAYGTQLLYPLSEQRYGAGIAFVIDPLFTGVALIGLWMTLRLGRQPWPTARILAWTGLIPIALYLGMLTTLRWQALRIADAWIEAGDATGPPLRVDALAQPFSPFNWKLVMARGTEYRVAHLSLLGFPRLLPRWQALRPWTDVASAYEPPAGLRWQARSLDGDGSVSVELVRALWTRPDFVLFRRFAVYPALSRLDAAADRSECVWFTDLRYDLPALPDVFRYGFCRQTADEPWRLFRLDYLRHDSRQALE